MSRSILGNDQRTDDSDIYHRPNSSFSPKCHPEGEFFFAKRSRTDSKDPTLPMPPDHRSYCVYILGSLSGTLYIGMTGNLHRRVFEHKFHRIEGFTDEHNIERLLYWESFDRVEKAIDREKQLKGWRRSKKTALVESTNPHWLDLSREWYPWMKECGVGRGASTP